MATELMMARLVSGYGKEAERKGKVDKDPITRDLLGGCPVMDMVMDAKDLDLALAVGSASASASASASSSSRDKPRDRHNTNTNSMLPGKMFLRSNSNGNGNPLQNQDLNLPPTAISLQIPDSRSSPRTSYVAAAAAASNINYQSVCTIEKVKFALERMGRESQSKSHAPSEGSPSPSPSSSSITSNSPIKRPIDAVVDGSCDSSVASVGNSNSMMAAACPKCLLYVLISKDNPRCPQCNSHVPPAVLSKNNNRSNKKPRINLNSTTLDLF